MNLPEESHSKKLEDKSIVFLQNLFLNEFENKYKFKFSKGRDYDYGVDCNLELKINGEMTNFNCHVQLKAIDKLEENAKNGDGSFSIQIKTSNLNYLLNTPKSLYILYVNSENVFYYEWADEFFTKLYKKDNDWLNKPGRKVLRFYEKLDEKVLLNIFEKVWERGKTGRKLDEKLALLKHLTNPKSPKIIINADNLEVESEHDIIEFIEKQGGYYLNKREENILVKLSDKTTNEYLEQSPLACLILGIANFRIGHSLIALVLINKAKNKSNLLDQWYQATLKYYEASIRYLMERINNSQLEEKLNQIEYEPHKLHLEFLKILREFRNSRELSEERLLPMRNFVKKMEKFSEKYPIDYLQSKIELLRVEGWYMNFQFGTPNADKEKLDEVVGSWITLRDNLIKEVESSEDEFLKADLNYNFVYVMTTFYVIRTFITRNKMTVRDNQILKGYEQLINNGMNISRKYNRNRDLCKLLVAKFNLYKLFDKESEAIEIFQELSQIAEVYDFPELVEEAKQNEKYIVEANEKALKN